MRLIAINRLTALDISFWNRISLQFFRVLV